jgi:hypothetical protein
MHKEYCQYKLTLPRAEVQILANAISEPNVKEGSVSCDIVGEGLLKLSAGAVKVISTRGSHSTSHSRKSVSRLTTLGEYGIKVAMHRHTISSNL